MKRLPLSSPKVANEDMPGDIQYLVIHHSGVDEFIAEYRPSIGYYFEVRPNAETYYGGDMLTIHYNVASHNRDTRTEGAE